MARGRKPKRPKAVKCVRIPIPEKLRGKGSDPDNPYTMLADVLAAAHAHLDDVKICLAWQRDQQCDRDGRVILVRTRKVGDLDRELQGFDFQIVLNQTVWEKFKRPQRAGMLDDGLSRCGVVVDREGEVVKNEQGRICYRTIKPDLVTFTAVVERHGFYHASLSRMAKITADRLKANPQEPLWDLVDPSALPFATIGDAMPSANGQLQTPGDWSGYSIAALDAIPKGIREKLIQANITTVGELGEYTQRRHPKTIPGIGKVAAEKLIEGMDKFWAARKAAPAGAR
jgi:hypothetical protein